MKRIAIIAPFVLALVLDASAGVKVNPATKPAASPRPPRVTCWVAVLTDPLGEFGSRGYGCSRTKERADAFCAEHRGVAKCEVLGLLKMPNAPKKAGGGK
jgi:hypothetical protein